MEWNISYRIGDATSPCISSPARVIAHVCNDLGAWGAGFTAALDRRWSEPRAEYLALGAKQVLGSVQLVRVGPLLWVANIVAQRGLPSRGNRRPLSYDALGTGLWALRTRADELTASVHMPRIGCGLGGGSWDVVSQIVARCLRPLEVYVYDLPS
jgi:O-acetyl-ADP-ribose deacetylase (regulator of RNase III)